MKQYEVFQMKFRGKEIAEDQINVPVKAEFTVGGKTIKVRGFCAGEGTFAVRYLPLETGSCTYRVEYPGADGKTEILEGNEEVAPAESGVHGPVRTDGTAGDRKVPGGCDRCMGDDQEECSGGCKWSCPDASSGKSRNGSAGCEDRRMIREQCTGRFAY